MALYMTQFSYTPEAWSKMIKNPQDRLAALKELAGKFNSKVIGFYYCNGEYDGLVILDSPDDQTANALLFSVIAAGHVQHLKTVHLYTMDDVIASLKKAGSASYKAPV